MLARRIICRHLSRGSVTPAVWLLCTWMVAVCGLTRGADQPAQPRTGRSLAIASQDWKGEPRQVAGLKDRVPATVGFPQKQVSKLTWESKQPLPAGLYELQLGVRASHAHEEIAWHGELAVRVNGTSAGSWRAIDFARAGEVEMQHMTLLHARPGKLRIEVAAVIDPELFAKVAANGRLKQDGPPAEQEAPQKPVKVKPVGDDVDLLSELTESLRPETHFYFVLDQAELRTISQSAMISQVTLDKVRYSPGESLTAEIVVTPLAPAARGMLRVELESGLAQRTLLEERPLDLKQRPKTIELSFKLPQQELGHALVATFTSADRQDRVERAEYFNIADNFNRVAIFGSLAAGHGGTFRTAEEMEKACLQLRSTYANAVEHFAWAEEDMVEMSPEDDIWYSGQTCYRLSKQGLRQLIRTAHEHGIAQVTYGKFVMSGYLGWKTAWNYPADHQGQFVFPIGMWEGTNVQILERFRFKEFVPYEHGVPTGGLLKPFWQSFNPINPDPTPRMVRVAAEETIRSIDMFDWDGIRWDGHARGGGPAGGGAGEFSYGAARKAQSLVRYFKDIVAQKHPRFRHGYNYLFVQEQPDYEWAHEDFELDELCRDGGLLMNESIGNTTAGRRFDWLAHNIQVEGDLARERGGYLLGISYASTPRDRLVESALYFAGGCRPMGGTAATSELNRYATRFSRYVFDESLRRLAQPDHVLRPRAETPLWWEPFMYETVVEKGKSQLVVNLLNIPRDGMTRGNDNNRPIVWDMPPGTSPVEFELTLPDGYQANSASLIQPSTLTVIPVDMQDPNVISVPAVDAWLVLIVDLERSDGTPSLSERYGAPRTFETPRPGLSVTRCQPVVLDVDAPVETCAHHLAGLLPSAPSPFTEDPKLAALQSSERNEQLLAEKRLPRNSEQSWLEGWWKGASLPADQQLAEKRADFGDLHPRRDGVCDVFIAAGALSHRLDLAGALARLPVVRAQEATLSGFSYNYNLRHAIGPTDLPRFDLAVYADIPHGAIGPEMAYALVDWVRQGGGVLFTGGQYSFGKGGYSWTVLDRELLPVQIVENLDVRIAAEPLTMEPGLDFEELSVSDCDFGKRPSLTVWNQVVLRPDAKVKVFLQAGQRPILVGWQLGQGRVACLLASHQGMSTDDSPLFCEWRDWPKLLTGVFRWLSPDAWDSAPTVESPTEQELAGIMQNLAGAKSAAVLDDLLDGGGPSTPAPDEPENEDADNDTADGSQQAGLDPTALTGRTKAIERLLLRPNVETAAILAEQLIGVSNLPNGLRGQMLNGIWQIRTTGGTSDAAKALATQLTKLARPGLTNRGAHVRGTALCLLALAGGTEFERFVELSLSQDAAGDEQRLEANRQLALALPWYTGNALQKQGQKLLNDWSRIEEQRLRAYAGGSEFTSASPPVPLLDSEALALRLGWLAHLATMDAEQYAAPFAREWVRLGQWLEYCEITEAGLWNETQNATPAQRAKVRLSVRNVTAYREFLMQLRNATQPRLEGAFIAQPAAVGQGFSSARFHHEALAAIGFLNLRPLIQSREALAILASAPSAELRHFAEQRVARDSNVEPAEPKY